MNVRGFLVWAVLVAWIGVQVSSIGAEATIAGSVVPAAPASVAPSYARWSNGPPSDPKFFPIAVWLQDPRNASRFKAAGINLYVALWEGPTSAQLNALRDAGMPVICAQNHVGLENKDNPIIVAWMHGDEPDNAQGLPGLRRFGPPVPPEKIIHDYERIRAADPSRPVLLNLGQGVAYDNYIGRGVRRNHPEDYKEYLKGCDIASFDIYPVVHDSAEVTGKLEFVPKGVARLNQWNEEKIVWNCIECTHIGTPSAKATPEQVRSEIWMSLIHGSRGLIYFVHQFKPEFKEAALLDDPVLLPAVTKINRRIIELAPALNSMSLAGAVSVTVNGKPVPADSRAWALATGGAKTSPPPLAWMVKRQANTLYLFAVNMHPEPVTAEFRFHGISGSPSAEVLDEARNLSVQSGAFSDHFGQYQVHLYSIQER